ncbi:MAG: methyl-accepting chemotaxis protein [Eubacterium sp.]|jgi:methyl-accepting chemotaxis protein|nr:methyl-accepting chemotaxis protein [Eubacterium sp.]
MYGKNRKVHKLGRKVGLLTAFLLILTSVAAVALCVRMFYTLTMNLLRDECVNGTNILGYQLSHSSEQVDMTELLDDLKEQLGCEFTVFQGNVRAYTTIIQDGERVVGTELSEDLTEIVLGRGESYVGNADVLGVHHLCSYAPVFDESGQATGLIFAGISLVEAEEQINHTIWLVILVGTAFVIFSLCIMTIFIRRAVSRPLSKLTQMAQTMEQGRLGISESDAYQNLDIDSNDEIGLLADIFTHTIERLRGYIGEISTILQDISKGSLSSETTQDYVGDFVAIRTSLDNILDKLNDTLSQIVDSSASVSNGAGQMSIGAQALSQGAVEQASAVEEVDGTVRSISQQVEQTAENAERASEKVGLVSGQILESNNKMHEMIRAMEEINASSNEISKIIKTIESIASQTNILALNAAVEAARAGEVGKGFAVVAQEVRELAGKSAEASKSTTELIERSIGAVQEGSKIAHATAKQLELVVSGTKEVVETTVWIAEAARSQADSVSEVQERISQISDVVQTNSATAEESAATSQQLSSQAELLKRLVAMFHLKRQG